MFSLLHASWKRRLEWSNSGTISPSCTGNSMNHLGFSMQMSTRAQNYNQNTVYMLKSIQLSFTERTLQIWGRDLRQRYPLSTSIFLLFKNKLLLTFTNLSALWVLLLSRLHTYRFSMFHFWTHLWDHKKPVSTEC